MKILIVDCETTGLVEPQAVEIAMIQLPEDIKEFMNLDIEKFFQDETLFEGVYEQRFRPTKAIDPRASAVTGIYMKDVINCPSIKTFEYPETNEFLVAHNAVFDWGVLGKPDVKRICTKELSQIVFADQKGLKNNKAVTVATWLYKDKIQSIVDNAHGALADCKLVFFILHAIVQKVPAGSWTELANLCSQGQKSKSYSELDKPIKPLTSLPFGKHKGVPLKDVPTDYLLWLDKQDVQPMVKAAVISELGRR